MKIYDTLDLTDPSIVVGNHGCWAPDREIKIPFQWGGRPKKHSRFNEEPGAVESISDEVCIMRALAALSMAPPIGEIVYFKEVISTHPGAWHCDPVGAYGYEMRDATKLPPGRFDIDEMRKLPIEGSVGAWGDVAKPDNTVNGYLVDVRRTGWDMLKWLGQREEFSRAVEPDLLARVHRDCQFPKGERQEAYQDFWLDGTLRRGQRRVAERARQMGFNPRPGESVLDIGTQSGSFLQYAHSVAGLGRYVGIEVDPDYLYCAKALARSCGQNICFRQMNAVTERDKLVEWVRAYFPRGVDNALFLSMEKHLGEDFMFSLIDEIGARRTFIETNAVGKTDGPMKLWEQVQKRGGVHVGDSDDRNLRRLYRIGS